MTASSADNKKEAELDLPKIDDGDDDGPKQEKDDLEVGQTHASTELPFTVFSLREKRFIVFMVAAGGFFSPLSANIYFPALPVLAKDLNVSSSLINLTLTTYMILQGIAPTIFGDLADSGGRRPAYLIGFLLYSGANIGLALQHRYVALLLLRCLQSSGSSATIALGNGVVADIATTSERGSYIGWAQSGALLGPVIGPILGGILAQELGWRWIFWFLLIFGLVYIIPYAIFCPETGRNVVGNGSIPPQGLNMSLLHYLRVRKMKRHPLGRTTSWQQAVLVQSELAKKRKWKWPNPLRSLSMVLEKDVGIILFCNAIIYTAFYTIITSLPVLVKDIYNFNELQIGLCFMQVFLQGINAEKSTDSIPRPFGVACCIGSICVGYLLDWNYRRTARNLNLPIDRKRGESLKDFPIEKARIQVMAPGFTIGVATTICWGWVLHEETSLAVPMVLLFIIGATLGSCFSVLGTLLVDLYPRSPATVTAANNLARCLMGAGGTAVIDPMLNAMGRGWCFAFIGLVCSCLTPLLLVEMQYGPKWREARRLLVERQAEKSKGHSVRGTGHRLQI
ncbi:MAG: hypothetical protein M1825_001450 [Sarcosagium campestre]|nr:MAG: hypothetical protein M1825_001450 [Sarcosagium campestre]